MRTILILVCFILGFSTTSYTKNLPLSTPHFNIPTSIHINNELESISIDLNKIGQEVILLVIKSGKNVIYIEDISLNNQNGIIEYNYSSLDSGDYTLEIVTSKNEKILTPFTK